MISQDIPNLIAWNTELAVQQLEAQGLAVRIVPTKPPRVQTELAGTGRVIRQRLIDSRLVELVVAAQVPAKNDGY